MFAKFATAKNREKLNPLTFSSSGAIYLKTTLEYWAIVKRLHSDWDSNLRPPDYKTGHHQSGSLSLSYRAKNTRVVRKTLSLWISREDNTIANGIPSASWENRKNTLHESLSSLLRITYSSSRYFWVKVNIYKFITTCYLLISSLLYCI